MQYSYSYLAQSLFEKTAPVREKTRVLPAGDGRLPRRPRLTCVPCPDSRDHVSMSPTREQDGGPWVSRRFDALATRLRRWDANTTRLRRCETRYDLRLHTNCWLTTAGEHSRIHTFINELFGPPEKWYLANSLDVRTTKQNYLRTAPIQGVSENTDIFISLPALVFITAQTLLGARIKPWTLEIYIHRLSSPFEPLPGNQSSWTECLPFLAKQISILRPTSARTLRHSRAVTALTHSVIAAFSSGRFRGSSL